MKRRDIIVIGGSAGALQALTEIVQRLPRDLPAALFVVIHTSPTHVGSLPQILARVTGLEAVEARDGAPIVPGRITIARPDHHLWLEGDRTRISRGPRQNHFRPAVDPLFHSAALHFGARVIGVVLSGGLDDGTEGLLQIHQRGGIAIVQDPDDAVLSSMPASAIRHVEVDYVLPSTQIAAKIEDLLRQPIREELPETASPEANEPEPDELESGALESDELHAQGSHSPFTCPDCGGSLSELVQDEIVRYRCHVGHKYSPDGLSLSHASQLENALWSAVRALTQSAELRRRMARRARAGGGTSIAERYDRDASAAECHALTLRGLLEERDV